jgi:hypothetical protein
MEIVRIATVKVNHHPKCPFWGSRDLSQETEKLFNAINLCENSKSLIISINLCNIKNMIHLSNLELDELSSLFSCNDLRDSSFSRCNHQDAMLMKVIFEFNQRKSWIT